MCLMKLGLQQCLPSHTAYICIGMSRITDENSKINRKLKIKKNKLERLWEEQCHWGWFLLMPST